MADPDLRASVEHLPTTSAKIRALAAQGVARAEIARLLGVRYQQVRNVLERDKVRATKPAGLSEPPQRPLHDDLAPSIKVRLGPEGRVVIPATIREALGLKEGDVLFARLEGGEIKLLTPDAAMRRAQAIVRHFVPEGVSLVDELIADRRHEAAREMEE
ncbi:MAG: AbrB/MazE/SpoVT family DNA-binding domain-containing protein [Hyphomicrobiales bacterium]|nr:AbrB/MazE/SpoVT family DNA-binding domain-containing protein [Hyphomicrobiales bacterium]MBV9429137.1 AbrB/MazE/SpoVT family DNA-binding domain-containing protein [Bradyrhizobiaceae bacterium]